MTDGMIDWAEYYALDKLVQELENRGFHTNKEEMRYQYMYQELVKKQEFIDSVITIRKHVEKESLHPTS